MQFCRFYDDNLRSYDELRAAIVATWDAVPTIYLEELLGRMPARCQAIIVLSPNGMYVVH